jgi:hypothetical protein
MTLPRTCCGIRSSILTPLVLALTTVSTGCSFFSASRRLDLGPFGENTVQVVGEIQKFQRPAPWVYLKKYSEHPKVLEVGTA